MTFKNKYTILLSIQFNIFILLLQQHAPFDCGQCNREGQRLQQSNFGPFVSGWPLYLVGDPGACLLCHKCFAIKYHWVNPKAAEISLNTWLYDYYLPQRLERQTLDVQTGEAVRAGIDVDGSFVSVIKQV